MLLSAQNPQPNQAECLSHLQVSPPDANTEGSTAEKTSKLTPVLEKPTLNSREAL